MKKEHVKLSEADRATLREIVDKGQHPARVYKRALALLEMDRGRTFTAVAEMVGVTKQTPSTWAKKYHESGLALLKDKPRPGRPREIDGIACAKITALACSEPPEGYGQWSLRLLAEKAVELAYCEHISHNAVKEILKKRTQAPSEAPMVYWQDRRSVSCQDGTDPLALCSPL